MSATAIISLRLPEARKATLQRFARRAGKKPAELGAQFLDEALRAAEFPHIEFRDSPVGRQAYIRGHSLAVWRVIKLSRAYRGDATQTAKHLEWPESVVQAAVNYSAAYSEEIEHAIQDDDAITAEDLARMVPGLKITTLRTLKSPKTGA